MKNMGKCPKCGGNEILPVRSDNVSNIVSGMRFLTAIFSTRFVCAGCGYVEEWIEDAADIQKLRKLCAKHNRRSCLAMEEEL